MKKLNRQDALQLLPAVVDNEAGRDEILAFFAYIEKDEYVREQYESALRIKKLIKQNYKKESAPQSLKHKVEDLISGMEWESMSDSRIDSLTEPVKETSAGDKQQPLPRAPLFNFRLAARYVAAAAVILFLTLVTIELLDHTSYTIQTDTFSIEQTTFEHFSSESPFQVAAHSISPQTLDDVLTFLSDEISYPLRMPLLDGAEINEVRYAEFANGFSTPVIEFYQEEIEEYVYVVAFNIDEIEENGIFKRDPEAVAHCQTYDDYHILEVEGKHVVSWKWGDYWYTAISNHNGDDLISLVTPHGYEEEQSSGSAW